jgi:hypothetical protein
VQTTNICEDCHNSVTWIPVVRVDHTQVLRFATGMRRLSRHRGLDSTHVQAYRPSVRAA